MCVGSRKEDVGIEGGKTDRRGDWENITWKGGFGLKEDRFRKNISKRVWTKRGQSNFTHFCKIIYLRSWIGTSMSLNALTVCFARKEILRLDELIAEKRHVDKVSKNLLSLEFNSIGIKVGIAKCWPEIWGMKSATLTRRWRF